MATPSVAISDRTGIEGDRSGHLRVLPAKVSSTRVHWLVGLDISMGALAYFLAMLLRAEEAFERPFGPVSLSVDWSMVILLGTTFLVFYIYGLYEWEVLMSPSLHLWTFFKALAVAFFISAGFIYIFKLPIVFQSRLIVFGTFFIFFLIAAIVRVVIVSHVVRQRVVASGRTTLVVGSELRTEALRERLGDLRGFRKIRTFDPAEPGGEFKDRFAALAFERAADGRHVFGRVFIDAGSCSYEDVVHMITVARAAGLDVYVVSRLVRALSGRRLLFDLFEAPVVKIRHDPERAGWSLGKRLFDIAVSVVALVLLSPVMLTIAVAVKLSSRGPVLFTQERIGRDGVPFRFYKFRSMAADADASPHAAYVKELINGNGVAHLSGDGEDAEEVFKLVSDPRITRVGRFLRKYSLDELPQFWNVLRGDMSMVGPRPPLPYEVSEYKPWHRERLLPTPGVSGLWQVQGRSRVSFDEMVFQDIMYACAHEILIDVGICLRTVPAAIIGRGGA